MHRSATGALPSFRWPARGRVIAAYGAKTNGKANDGINLAVPEGTPVKAAEDGVVAYAGSELKGYGNLVLVRHSNGYVTAYAHASELMVKRGEADAMICGVEGRYMSHLRHVRERVAGAGEVGAGGLVLAQLELGLDPLDRQREADDALQHTRDEIRRRVADRPGKCARCLLALGQPCHDIQQPRRIGEPFRRAALDVLTARQRMTVAPSATRRAAPPETLAAAIAAPYVVLRV